MLSLAHSFGRLKAITVSELYAAFYGTPVTASSPIQDVAVAKAKFPKDAIFTRLRQISLEKPDLLFHDDSGVDAGYDDLIRDVIHLRRILKEQLPASSFNADGSFVKDARSIGFLAYNAYYFIVSFFAIAALGGICVPLSTDVNAEEASYFLKKTKVTYLLTEASIFDKAVAFRDYVNAQPDQALNLIQLSRAQVGPNPSPVDWAIDDSLTFAPTDGCIVLFTSGTTGLPKGVLLPRKMFHFTEAPPVQEVVYLASCPVHWVGGTGLIDSVLVGENLHMMKNGSEPRDFWEIQRSGRITDMSVSPTLLRRLMECYDNEIHCLADEERGPYINGSKSLKSVFTSGSALNPSLAQRFKDLTGTHVRNGYGITEMGGGVMATPEGSTISEGYVGKPFPGVTVKLSGGDHGEVLVKTPNMFIGYVDDDEATRACFDDEGFYKTGDCAHRVGEDYYFDGRNSCDWIRFHEYTISVLDLEQRLMDLPYICEAHILPVRDREAGGLVAALIRIYKQSIEREQHYVDLSTLREDLARVGVVSYKLPSILRLLQEGEQVPCTASGKVQKKEALRRYFGIVDCMPPDQYAHEGVEFWGNGLDLDASSRLFDWGGL